MIRAKKGPKILLGLLVTLAVIFSLFAITLPAMASEISGAKTTSPVSPNIYHVGDTIHWVVTISNPPTNNATNTLTRVWDTLPDGTVVELIASNLIQTPGQSDSWDVYYTVDATDLVSLNGHSGVKNKAEAEGTDSAGDNVYVRTTKNSRVIQPAICVEKTVDCNDDGEYLSQDTGSYGDTPSWKIDVQNCGDSPLHSVNVTDTNGMSWGPFDLAIGETWSVNYTGAAIYDTTTNNATVVGLDELSSVVGPVQSSATNVVEIEPCVEITKTVDCNDDGEYLSQDTGSYGDTPSWKIDVHNCGDSPLHSVNVTDTNGMSWGPFDLAIGETWSVNYTGAAIYDTTTNNATVVGLDVFDAVVGPVQSSATNVVEIRPCIEITKTVDCNDDGEYLSQDSGSFGDTPSWKIDVHNCGDSPLHSVNVTDTNGMSWGPFDLAIDQTWSVNYTGAAIYETTTNNATAVGLDELGGVVGPESSSATNVVEIRPCIEITKTVDCNDDGEYLSQDTGSFGDTPSWKIDVHNCGDTPLHGVNVTDTNGMSWGPFDLAIDQTWSVNYTGAAIYETTTNNATVMGLNELGGVVGPEYSSATNVVTECTGCLKICKYEDKNGNGVRDPSCKNPEPYLSGWTFNVTGPGYSQLVTTGDSCGTCGCSDYCVTIWDLAVGEYSVTEVTPLPDGWTNTDPGDGTYTKTVYVDCYEDDGCDGGCDFFALCGGGDCSPQCPTVVEFGNQRECTGCLKIYKYEDKDGDGSKDYGEGYLQGWTFNVTDPEGDSQLVTTGGSGGTCGGCDYGVTLCDLVPGQYTVTEVTPLPEGWTNTDPGGTAPYTKTVTVECDKTKTVKFGNQGPCTGCIKIYKYEDKNGNGERDSSWRNYEPYLKDWEFAVIDVTGNIVGSGTTNRYGYVKICGLPAGEYTITEVLKEGWTNTDPGGGTLTGVTVCCGKTTTIKFGNQRECQ